MLPKKIDILRNRLELRTFSYWSAYTSTRLNLRVKIIVWALFFSKLIYLKDIYFLIVV